MSTLLGYILLWFPKNKHMIYKLLRSNDQLPADMVVFCADDCDVGI